MGLRELKVNLLEELGVPVENAALWEWRAITPYSEVKRLIEKCCGVPTRPDLREADHPIIKFVDKLNRQTYPELFQ